MHSTALTKSLCTTLQECDAGHRADTGAVGSDKEEQSRAGVKALPTESSKLFFLNFLGVYSCPGLSNPIV
jgi:hypothetical protein